VLHFFMRPLYPRRRVSMKGPAPISTRAAPLLRLEDEQPTLAARKGRHGNDIAHNFMWRGILVPRQRHSVALIPHL
jgi:hypothetical protein